jgi:hypothetical protein
MTLTITRYIPETAMPTSMQSFAVLSSETNTDLVFYKPETGEILQVAGCGPAELEFFQLPGCARLQVKADVKRDYVDLTGSEPVVHPRPEIESLDALPIPATVTVTCRASGAIGTYTVEDGSFDYDDLPGTYDVHVSAWPHHDAHFVLEITP